MSDEARGGVQNGVRLTNTVSNETLDSRMPSA
jgi:hypothetical protein